MSDKLKQLNEKIQKQQEQFKEETIQAFGEAVREVFEAYPIMTSFSWPQYTPFFNDGDECVFGVRTDDPNINGIDGYEIAEAWSYEKHHYPDKNVELLPAKEAVQELLAGVPDEFMKAIFGDHKEITYHRDGEVEIEDYEHD